MPRYEVKIPGRGTFEVESPEPLTDQQAYAAALQQIQAGKVEKPASGILGALGKGFESSVSAARAGIKGLIAPEEAAEEAKARGEDIGRRYAEQVSLEKVKKAYEERGLLPAAGEAISQIPYAIAEQAPNIAATLAGGRLGAMAGAPFGPAGVIGGALVGAATPSLFQQAGGNIQRQAEEAIARGETPEISRLAAYGTGAVQAGLDVAGTLIPLGRSLVGKAFGPAVERALAKGAEEGAEKLAKETLLKTLAKGTAVGALAELPTEVTQQMLERAQAGLPILSEDALAEYGETAYQVGLLAPIGAAGRVVERSQARDIVEQRTLSKQARERQAERAKLAEQEAQQEQFKQTDKYALKFVTDHDALQKEYDDNAAVLKKKLPPGSSFADRQTFDDLKKRQKELKEQLQSQAAEYNKLLPKVQGLRDAEAQQKAQLAAQQEQAALAEQQARMREEQLAGPMQQQVIPGMEPPTLREPKEEVTPEQSRALSLGLTQQRQEIEKLLEDNQQAQSDAVEKGDFDLRRRLAGQRTALQSELNYLNTQLKKAGVYTDEIAKAQKLQAQLDKARQDLKNMSGPGFDPAAADKLDAKIQKLEEELSQYGGVQQALDLGKAEPLKGLPPQAARADYGARVYKPGAADIEAQEAALREEEARAEEARLAEERRAQKVAPEEVALRRIGERYASPTAVGRGQVSSEVDQIVESILERQQPAFAGQVVSGEGLKIVDRGDALRAQLAYARVTNNKERIEELKKRLADLNEPETEVAGEAPALGVTARQAGVEGRETPETRAADQVTRLSQSQLVAYDRLSNFINTVREREVPSDETRVRTLKEGAYRMRDTVVGLALNEADARLAQVGRPGLTTDQQLQLVAALERPLNELIQRGALALMPPVAQSAQMRGTRIVMGAKESQAGKRLFGSFPAASNTIRAQIRSVIDKAIGARAPKEKGKPVKAEGLRVQFAATAKERTEEQLFKEAYAEATDAEARELERIQKRLPYVDNQFVRSAIMDSVRDKANGKALTLDDKSQQALTALDRAVQDEGAQAELFPGETAKGITRTTPGKFQRFLDSAAVSKLRAKYAEYKKQASMVAKRAATIQARIEAEAKAAEDYVNNLLAGKAKSPVEAAQRALAQAKDKNAEAARIADAINDRRARAEKIISDLLLRFKAGQGVLEYKLRNLEEAKETLSKDLQALFEGRFNRKEIAKLEPAVIKLFDDIEVATKELEEFNKSYEVAKNFYTKLLKTHANDTVDNALLREAAKTQRRVDAAQRALDDAIIAEAKAKQDLEEQVTETEEQRRQRALLYPSAGVRRTVVVRDTSDSAVQTALKNYRGIIAKKEEEYVVAIKTLDAARNDVVKAEKELAKARDARKGVTQAQKDLREAQVAAQNAEVAANSIALSIEKTYRNVYAALDNAPLRQFEVASKEDVQAFEQYEESQRRLADAELKASFAEKGLAEPKTPARRKLGPVTKVQSAAPTTMRTGTEESRAGLTTRGQPVGSRITTVEDTEAELKRLNKIVQRSALGDIAAKRAELNQINDQLKFIAANPKGTTRTGKPKLSDKQEAAKKAAEARKRELQAELTKLVEEQKTTVKQAQERKAAGKALRAETRKLARTEAEETGEVSGETAPETQLDFDLQQNIEPMTAKNLQNKPAARELLYKGKSWSDYLLTDETISDALLTLQSIMEVRGITDPIKGLVELKVKFARSLSATEAELQFVQQIRAADLSTRTKAVNTVGVKAPPKKAPPKKPNVATNEEELEAGVKRNYQVGFDTTAQVHGMTFAEAARVGAARSSSPMVKMLFNRLEEVFDKAPTNMPGVAGRVFVLDGLARTKDGMGWAGFFIPNQNVVLTSPEKTRSYNKVLLHELTHAATVYGLSQNPELNDRVTELRERVIDWLDSKEGKAYFRKHRMELQARTAKEIYGLKNNKEFLAEVFADRGFQKLLTEIPSTQPRKSVFTRLVEALSKFFSLPDKAAQSAFADAIALTEEVLAVTENEIYGNNQGTKKLQDAVSAYKAGDVDPYAVPFRDSVNPALQGAMSVVDQVVAKQKPISDRVRAASGGFLGAETQLVDRFAGFEKLAKYMPKYQGAQMLYYLRMYDQKMNYTSQSAGNGALQLVPYKRPDGETEYIIESVDGANLRNVVLILRDAKNLVGDVDATSRLFTFYLAAKRAERVGFDKLDISGQVTEVQLRDVVRQVESVKGLKEIFESARDEYNQYNADQIRFMVQAGVMNQEEANRLLKAKDYIPWYRSRNGVVEMMIGGETPFKVGNIKDTPHLEQLVGGSEPILDFMVSSVQNTNMLVDMALNNIAKRNAIIELADMGAAIITPKPTSGRDVVKFKYHGEDRYAILQTEQIKIGDKVIDTGVPADLLVKGMEGIPLQVSGVMRLMSIPTMILRKSVTLNPAQMFRQLFRDTTQAYLAAGSDAAPVLGALKEIGAGTRGVLEKRGITGGQVFTGTAEDISKIMREIAKGGVNATRLLAGLEASAAEVDAATRRSQYNSYLKQGMSQMEATLLALESMNFNKRGASPSVHAANALYPFFNAQIQGINVLYKAMFGQLSPSDRARIKEKLITRATMMIAVTLAYAHMMQDDEAYKNATPEQKYFNWFVRIPGVEEPVRIPIPFEPGYIFKALPEAMYNRLVAQTTTAADEAKGAMAAILRNIIPGASNWFVPQAIATPVQIGANYSFFQGRSILSKREQELLPEQQYRDNTTELAKLFGGATGISPIMFEEAVRGYFAGLGLATLQIASLPITPKEGPEKATKRLSQMPVVGALFQPNDAGWIINNTYDTLDEARKTQRTVTELINRGEIAQARALMEERKSDYVRAELEGYYRQEMGQLTQLEAAIRASSKTPDEKREFLDRVRQYKIKLAAMVRDASDKTKLQADLS